MFFQKITNILKKMIAENKRLCVGSSSIRNYSKKWHEIQFHCARFERRTGKGDFDILHQIWLQICFSMKHNIKTTFVNVFTGKSSGKQIKDISLEVDFKLLSQEMLSQVSKLNFEVCFLLANIQFCGRSIFVPPTTLFTSYIYFHWNILFITFIFELFKFFRDRRFSKKETR